MKVSSAQTGLALQEQYISQTYSLYANGIKLIDTQNDTGEMIVANIPDDQTATGSVVIALRVQISPSEWATSGPGFYSSNLRLEQPAALAKQYQLWLTAVGENAVYLLGEFISLCVSLAALLLYSAQRRHREYLWLFLAGVSAVPYDLLRAYSALHPVPLNWHQLDLVLAVRIFFMALMYFAFVRQRVGRLLMAYVMLASLSGALQQEIFTYTYPILFGHSFLRLAANQRVLVSVLTPLPFYFLELVLLPALLLTRWRRGNREAGILLIPLIATNLISFIAALAIVLVRWPASLHFAILTMDLIDRHANFFDINFGILTAIFSWIALSLIILLRTNRLSREGAELEGEMAAARQVQQVMLPEQIEAIPGFTIESVYLPAKQVGGDFFQILAVPDGGMLVVVGDVAGKGLPAAMLVSVLVRDTDGGGLWARSGGSAGAAQ